MLKSQIFFPFLKIRELLIYILYTNITLYLFYIILLKEKICYYYCIQNLDFLDIMEVELDHKERKKKLKEKLKNYTMDELLDLVILGLKQDMIDKKNDEQEKAC